MNFATNQPLQIISDGRKFIIQIDDKNMMIADDSYVTEFDVNTQRDMLDVTSIGGGKKYITGVSRTTMTFTVNVGNAKVVPADKNLIAPVFKSTAITKTLEFVDKARQFFLDD